MTGCTHPVLHKSRRSRFERLLTALIGLRPFRCDQCNERFWRPDRSARGSTVPGALVAGGLLIVLVALIAYWLNGFGDPIGGFALEDVDPSAQLPLADSDESQIDLLQDTPVSTETRPSPAAAAKSEKSADAPRSVNETGQRVMKIQSDTQGDAVRLRIDYTGAKTTLRLGRLDKPPRIVLDLDGQWQVDKKITQPRSLDSSWVNQMRFGTHTGKFRVVLDLASTQAWTHTIAHQQGYIEMWVRPKGDG